MSDKPKSTANNRRSKSDLKRGFSLYTKIILTFLLILALAAAAFTYNAWRQLTLTNAEDNIESPPQASVEVWTPAGAQTNNASAIFIPPVESASATSMTAETASDTAISATIPTTVLHPPKPKPDTTEIPVLPVDPVATTNNPTTVMPSNNNDTKPATTVAPVQPVDSGKKTEAYKDLDNLF